MPLLQGQKAPDFKLKSTNGGEFHLSKDALGQSLILFFYPKDFTPGCTAEVCSFRDNFDLFAEVDITILGISTDNVHSHKAFKEKHQLPYDLLSDPSGRVAKLYRAHIPLLNLSRRMTYLIDKNHSITAVYSEMFGAKKHIKNMILQISK